MKGMQIEIKSDDKDTFKYILKGIDFDNYEFDVDYYESYEENIPENWAYFDDEEKLTSNQAKATLLDLDDDSSFPEFMELFIRPKHGRHSEIDTYKEFIDSDYDMGVIILDKENIQIYCKNEEWLNHIKGNIERLNKDKQMIGFEIIDNIDDDLSLNAWKQQKEIGVGY